MLNERAPGAWATLRGSLAFWIFSYSLFFLVGSAWNGNTVPALASATVVVMTGPLVWLRLAAAQRQRRDEMVEDQRERD